MIKQLLLCSALLITGATNMNAQSKTGKTVGYKVLLDDPNKLRPGFICLDVLTADTWNSSSFMGYGVRAGINARRFGSITFDYRKGYLGAKQKATELGGALNLFSSRKKTMAFVVMSSSTFSLGNKMFMKKSGIEIPAIKKTVLQARGGIASFRAPIDESPDGLGKSANEDPRTFYMEKDTASLKIGFGKGYKGVYGFNALMKMQVYYVGLSIGKYRNIVVDHGDGVATNANNYNFFVDILTGGDPAFSNVEYYYRASSLGTYDFPAGTQPEDYSLVTRELKSMGWRAGWEAKSYAGLAMSYKVEFGSRPGYKMGSGILSANSYLLLTAGFGIGVGKSYKKMLHDKSDK